MCTSRCDPKAYIEKLCSVACGTLGALTCCCAFLQTSHATLLVQCTECLLWQALRGHSASNIHPSQWLENSTALSEEPAQWAVWGGLAGSEFPGGCGLPKDVASCWSHNGLRRTRHAAFKDLRLRIPEPLGAHHLGTWRG